MKRSLGLIEVHSWSASLAVLDCLEKAADVELLQIELNDLYGTCIKVTGTPADLSAAMEAGEAVAKTMHAACVSSIMNAPEERGRRAYEAPREFSPLIESDLVLFPDLARSRHGMAEESPFAIGMIETQGLTAVFEAIDTACKAADVEVVGREKLGGGYITIIIKGDVAAVKAAVEAGAAKVDGLGKLIAAHVIPRPSKAIVSLLPKA